MGTHQRHNPWKIDKKAKEEEKLSGSVEAPRVGRMHGPRDEAHRFVWRVSLTDWGLWWTSIQAQQNPRQKYFSSALCDGWSRRLAKSLKHRGRGWKPFDCISRSREAQREVEVRRGAEAIRRQDSVGDLVPNNMASLKIASRWLHHIHSNDSNLRRCESGVCFQCQVMLQKFHDREYACSWGSWSG